MGALGRIEVPERKQSSMLILGDPCLSDPVDPAARVDALHEG